MHAARPGREFLHRTSRRAAAVACLPDVIPGLNARSGCFRSLSRRIWTWHGRGSRRRRSSASARSRSAAGARETTAQDLPGRRDLGADLYEWRREYGGLKIDHAKRLKELERENERLKKAVSELTLDKRILKESSVGKILSPPRKRRAWITCARNWSSPSDARVRLLVDRAPRNVANQSYATTRWR